jgi:hypothetical protein
MSPSYETFENQTKKQYVIEEKNNVSQKISITLACTIIVLSLLPLSKCLRYTSTTNAADTLRFGKQITIGKLKQPGPTDFYLVPCAGDGSAPSFKQTAIARTNEMPFGHLFVVVEDRSQRTTYKWP